MKKYVLALSSLFLFGCTQAGLELANLPAKFSDTHIIKNIPYGSLGQQSLDMYIPKHTSTQALPVVIFFYGGSWQDGSKDMYAFVGEALAKQGYLTVIPDYRKYPDVRFPAFVEDGAQSVAWVYRHAAQYGADIGNVFIAGHSAGAHIGALISTDKHYLQQQGLSRSVIKAFAGLSGPYDFVPKEEAYKKIFGPPENYPNMQVPTFVDGHEPPMLLLWGKQDTLVGKSNMDLLAKKIHQEGGHVQTKIYDNLDHVGLISSFTWFLRGKAPVLKDVCHFFEHYKT